MRYVMKGLVFIVFFIIWGTLMLYGFISGSFKRDSDITNETQKVFKLLINESNQQSLSIESHGRPNYFFRLDLIPTNKELKINSFFKKVESTGYYLYKQKNNKYLFCKDKKKGLEFSLLKSSLIVHYESDDERCSKKVTAYDLKEIKEQK